MSPTMNSSNESAVDLSAETDGLSLGEINPAAEKQSREEAQSMPPTMSTSNQSGVDVSAETDGLSLGKINPAADKD